MRRHSPLLLALALVVPACASSGSSRSESPTTVAVTIDNTDLGFAVPNLEWAPCGDGLDCATLVAPLDYAEPQGASVRLAVTRHAALKKNRRIGSLLVNPGGPGLGAGYLVEAAPALLSSELLDSFDIVGMDPRGTGKSTPAIDCIDDYDKYFSVDFPDTAAGQQQDIAAVKEFNEQCEARSGRLLEHVSTQDTARDMDLLRRALGEQRISYLGFSYGSELGAAWVTMFPTTVRAAVFDGAADPTTDGMQDTIDQAQGFESALNAFLDDCRKRCAFAGGADPGAAFDAIMAQISRGGIPTAPGRPELSLSIAYVAVANALYSASLWPRLDEALDAASKGDGAPLLAGYDDYFQRNEDGTYGNLIEAFIAISCADDRGPTSVEGVDSYYARIVAVAPRLAPSFRGGYSCVFWPAPSAPKLTITGKGAGPILVIGTTNDPATPLAGTRNMAKALEAGVLITVSGQGHLGYRQSKCARDLVDAYLVDGKVPAGDVVCG